MKKIKWIKFWTRNFSLLRYWVYIESNKLPFYKKNFGKIFNYALAVPNGKLVEYYHDERELDDLTNRIYKVSCKNFKTFQRFSKKIFDWVEDFINFNNSLDAKKLSSLSDGELAEVFAVWYKKYLHWQISVYFYFVLEPILTRVFLADLENYLTKHHQENRFTEYSEIIMTPEKMNAVTLEQLMAMKTALGIKRSPLKKQALIKKYYQSFRWIPCYDIKDEEYDVQYFEKQVDKLGHLTAAKLKNRITSLEQEFKERPSRFKEVLRGIKDKKLIELAKIMHWLVYYKDHRDDKRREASFSAKNFMNVLARRFSLTLMEANYLLPEEIRDWLEDHKKIELQVIKQRLPANYVLLAMSGSIRMFVGEKMKEILKKELDFGGNANGEALKGVIGCKGKANGKVAIVRHTISLSKVQAGDVLVAVTTHPEYVPAMKKCCAIITDEGGITSHAAIVARELAKPCIVGTKTATQFLKDGDLVEVDADSGIIKKICPT